MSFRLMKPHVKEEDIIRISSTVTATEDSQETVSYDPGHNVSRPPNQASLGCNVIADLHSSYRAADDDELVI